MAESPTNNAGEKPRVDLHRMRLGEMMVLLGLIDNTQLEKALKRQSQVSARIGSILLEMGFITIDDLLNFLSNQFDVEAINLFQVDIDPSVLELVDIDTVKMKQILPVALDQNTLSIAMVNPKDMAVISELQFKIAKKIKPLVVPAFMMDAAIDFLLKHPKTRITGTDIEKTAEGNKEKPSAEPHLRQLLAKLTKKGVNDIILTAGAPPSVRISNELIRLSLPILTPKETQAYAQEMMSEAQWQDFLEHKEADFGFTYPDIGRYRVNTYWQRHSVSIAIRPIVEKIPSLKELNIPAWIEDFALRPQGIIIICGPAGHGKSTTLSAMVDIINTNKQRNIITLEDPVEYMHKHKKSNISQREVGTDTESFYSGLKTILRQAPDVIVVGEMRDKDSFDIALTASYTGHLVITTMHANNATTAIENAIQMFEPHRQSLIRMMLSEALLVCLSQRLVPVKGRNQRILAIERLINTYRIRNLIREGKAHQIRTQMQAGSNDFTSIDHELAKLHQSGAITYEAGLAYAENKEYYDEMLIATRSAKRG